MTDIKQKIDRLLTHFASEEDVADIRRWFEGDERLGSWLREGIEQSYPQIDPAADARIRATLAQAQRADETQAAGKSRSRRPRFTLSQTIQTAGIAAVILCIIASVAIVLHRDTPYQNPVIASTGVGQQSTITLPDGSTVTVNAMTQVRYQYNQSSGTRNVDITGEAYFNVARDPSHPFIVSCGSIAVECRGTEFDVKNYPDDNCISVVLNSGEVLVADATNSITMKPDMIVQYEKHSGLFTSGHVNAADYTSWMQGYLQFTDQRFDDIVTVLSRSHNMRIEITDSSLRDELFTGNLGIGDIHQRLKILCSAAEASYSIDDSNTAHIYRK